MKLYTINTGNFKLDGGAMFGVVPKSIWNKLNTADENNMCSWALRCLLIEDEGKLILIDTGMGNKQSDKFFGHYYLYGNDTLEKSLLQHGFSPDDVTDVLLTHLHFDHCGGAIVYNENNNLVPFFKNATYWSNAVHWKTAIEPNAREKASFLKENILPIETNGQLQFVDSNNGLQSLSTVQFTKNIAIRFVNGHTTAMMLPQIQYKNKTIVYMADLLPSVGHVALPYVMAYDMQPLITLQEKKLFLEEAAANNYILFLEHDVQHECCTLQQTENGVKLKETFSLVDVL